MKIAPFACCLTVLIAALLACLSANAQEIDPETGFPWGKHNAPTGYISHFEQGTRVRPTRAAMTYAYRLLAREDKASQTEGARVLRNVIKYQDSDPNNKTYGVWPWYIEEPFDEMLAIDFNWADFLGATLISILTNYSDRLPPDVVDEAKASLDRACACIKKRDVKPNYTNIAYMGAVVCAAGGELLGKPEYLEYARMRMERNVNSYKEIGGFTEYNSPTYTMVVLVELERALQYVKDESFREMAQYMHKEVWKTIAMHYHPATGQWSGPFSRAYRDLLSADERNRFLARAGLVPKNVRVGFETGVNPLPCGELRVASGELRVKDILASLHNPPVQFTENYNNARENFRLKGTTYMDNDLSLGTASLVGVCYEGEEKPFKMDELNEVRIAVGVEFLKEGETQSSAPVTISDDPYSTKSEGAFYRVEWDPVDTSASPLLAPCKSTKY